MSTPSVTVNALDLKNGHVPSVVRFALFVGVSTLNNNTLQILDQDSDLDVLIGAGDLRDNIDAAKLNARTSWSCAAVPIGNADDPFDAIDIAIAANVVPEIIVVLPPVATSAEVNGLMAKAVELKNQTLRLSIIGTIAGIDNTTENWGQFQTRAAAVIDSVDAERVTIVPQLNGNNAGVYAGRLCNEAVSFADSPCRVKTGALIGLGEWPEDSDGVKLDDANLNQLASLRYSVPFNYKGRPGTFWGFGKTLAAPGSDYVEIENLRVMDVLASATYLRCIDKIGDRTFNNSTVSEKIHKKYFAIPLDEMSVGTTVGDEFWPAEIQPPSADAITIQWVNDRKINIFIKARPYASPKDITANLSLERA